MAIEIGLVVVGVFLGLQVSNWNDARKERALEATYLARIAEDVRSDVADMDEIIRVSAVRMALLKELHFEVGLEQNRDKLVDAERKLGISPVKPMTVDDLSAAFAASPELLATAQNYWLYTNRHLKLMRDLQAQARELAGAIGDKSR